MLSAFGAAVSPKAALNVRASDQVRLRASYGHGYRAPDLGQLYYRFLNPTNIYQIIGNPDLQHERSHSVQVGGELSARNGRARLGWGRTSGGRAWRPILSARQRRASHRRRDGDPSVIPLASARCKRRPWVCPRL